jgi:GxxExxY protein
MSDPMRDPLTYKVLGAYFTVYRELGWGLLEAVYQRATFVALTEVGLSCEREVRLPVHFHGHLIGEYKADLLVEGAVLVELKAVEVLHPFHRSQLLNYLKASTIERGLLLNFGPRPAYERIAFTSSSKASQSLRF